MNERPAITGRMVWGLVVLTLGVLWTLDNLGQIDASEIVRWWPLVALGWGLMLLTGANGPRKPTAGWIWTIIGTTSLLRPLGIANADVFDFWPMLLVVLGGGLVWRAWTGKDLVNRTPGTGPRLDASAFLAGSQRKVVSDEFSQVDINAVMAATTLDLRSARLAGGSALVDVYAMWGGIDLIVPPAWRVVSEVTPILGVYQDLTEVPADPAAPTLIVRGSVVMGGIEVRNDELKSMRARARTVRMGPGSVVVRAGVVRDDDDSPRSAGNA
jgi:hypothetical protein